MKNAFKQERGTLLGIEYYYIGDKNWTEGVPQIRIEARNGCDGCAWYDVEQWRQSLNKKIGKEKEEK